MEMSYKDWLSLGLKVLGVVTIVDGLAKAIINWGSLVYYAQDISPWMMIGAIVMPPVIIGAGLYLLLGTQGLVDRVWPEPQQELGSARAMFMVAIKVVGVVLFVQALPEVVQILSRALYINSLTPVWNTGVQSEYIYERLASTTLKLLIGCYLLLKGDWLQRVAFPPSQEQ